MSSPSDSLPDESIRLLEVFYTFERAFARRSQSLIEAEGGSPARLRLLGVLNCTGPRIMCGLQAELGVTARQVTNLVDALEAEGLVRRMPHASDRRATVIEITPRGAEQASVMWGPLQEKMAGPFRDLPEADRRELLRLMETLLAALRRRDQEDRGCREVPFAVGPPGTRRIPRRRQRGPAGRLDPV
jgi:DNA-binding MarR family transcriptional regulator